MAAPSPSGSAPAPPRAPPAPSPSTNEPGRGLRARKLSLSTRHLPAGLSTSSQLSPSSSTNPSSPSLANPEVGLGLMLDEMTGTASARSSIDSSQSNLARSRASSIGTDRRSNETDEFFLAATTGDASMRRSLSRGLTPSTVTGPSGTTASPLPIYTGSPSPGNASPSPTPGRAHSPSHQAYNLGPVASGSGATSMPMSRPPSYASVMGSAQDMERSRSTGSEHSRHQSLTSACAPVTSSVLNTPKSDVGAFSPQLGGGGGTGSARNSWRTYDWGAAASEKGYSSDEDVREGAKRRRDEQPEGLVGRAFGLPTTILAWFLRPLQAPTPPTSGRLSPQLNASSKNAANGASTAKRYPLVVRLVLIAYLVFSFLYLTVSLSQAYLFPTSSSSSSATSASPEGWQLVREYAEGVGAKAGLGWMRGNAGAVPVTPVEEEEGAMDEVPEWGTVQRIGHPDKPSSLLAMQTPEGNPLTHFTHTYRFSKMHDKAHWDLHDEIVPFAFRASSKPEKDDVTACMYTNEAWLPMLSSFVRTWRGPVSLVFETAHSRLDTASRASLVTKIAELRDSDPLIRQFVDFHIVGAPTSVSDRTLAKTRERMIRKPFARNYQLNLARFFAPTEVVFLVGDARITPSGGLRRRLTEQKIRKLVLERGDAIVVPSFGFVRDPTGSPTEIPTLPQLRTQLGIASEMDSSDPFAGVAADEFEPLAAEHLRAVHDSLPIAPEDWPTRKQQLVQLVNTRVPSVDSPTSARLALFDRRWDLNHGPSNWYLWRKSATDPRLQEDPAQGGGLGLGVAGATGGGKDVYRVVDYDLHYAPLVAVSKKGQPWCTERFDDVRASCVYQMYLSGAEMWVLPDEWTYTVEVLEKRSKADKEDPGDKLKNSISARLYGKFHQEACMHYGREFLSVSMWDSDKAQHLRETCARTLSSWGMGAA
ncbi:hypothetical protein Rhopal_003358-T1 [Rhodotorula paludigena]|uniref:Glycosyltransferase family 49 protein n=1 Tax=Rhodotorula paludigena TaxID=86838 RepID=A0AAV5GJC5_9BASI|nr:hypothetical protein Rhopal_003358-T1 [Rhodotorula paludigena]